VCEETLEIFSIAIMPISQGKMIYITFLYGEKYLIVSKAISSQANQELTLALISTSKQ